MNERQWGAVAVGAAAGGIGLALGAVALLVAAFRIEWDRAASWFIVLVQVLIALSTLIVVIALAAGVFYYVTITLDGFIREHSKGAKIIKDRTPALGALMILGADTLKLLADRSFSGSMPATIAASFALLVGFWVANEVTVRFNRFMGLTAWYLTALTLPLFFMQNRRWDFDAAVGSFFGLAPAMRALIVLGVIVFVFLPLIPMRESAAE